MILCYKELRQAMEAYKHNNGGLISLLTQTEMSIQKTWKTGVGAQKPFRLTNSMTYEELVEDIFG